MQCCTRQANNLRRLLLSRRFSTYKQGHLIKSEASTIGPQIKNCRLINTTATCHKEFDTDEPVRFSGSKADRDSTESFVLPKRNGPRYETIIVKTSFLAFMVYFCALREENDLDDFLRDNVVW